MNKLFNSQMIMTDIKKDLLFTIERDFLLCFSFDSDPQEWIQIDRWADIEGLDASFPLE